MHIRASVHMSRVIARTTNCLMDVTNMGVVGKDRQTLDEDGRVLIAGERVR